MENEATIAPTGVLARPGRTVPTVRLANCRHGFGEALRFDAVVDGAYPDRRFCLWLSQPAEIYKGIELRAPEAYIAIPSFDFAQAVIDAINVAYHLCNAFRKGEPITVHLCGENAPEATWELVA